MPDDSDGVWDVRSFNPANAEILRDRINDIVNREHLQTYKSIIDGADINASASKLSRYVRKRSPWDALGPHTHRSIVDYLRREGYWSNRKYLADISAIPDHLYHSIISYFSIQSGTEDNVRRQTRGLYRVYTPSLIVPGGIIVGMSNIEYDQQSQAMNIREKYIYREASLDKTIKLRTLINEYDGYVFRKSKKYFFFMRDESASSLRIVIIPSPFRQSVEITTMTGMVLGTINNRAYTSRIFYERYEGSKEELEKICNIYPEGEIPIPVMACFEERETKFSKIF